MKATCLLIDSIYSFAVSDSSGKGAENEILGLGFVGVGEVVGGDGRREQGLQGEVQSWKYPSGSDLGLPKLALVPEPVLTLVPEQVLALPVVACLPQTSWHPTRGPVFL